MFNVVKSKKYGRRHELSRTTKQQSIWWVGIFFLGAKSPLQIYFRLFPCVWYDSSILDFLQIQKFPLSLPDGSSFGYGMFYEARIAFDFYVFPSLSVIFREDNSTKKGKRQSVTITARCLGRRWWIPRLETVSRCCAFQQQGNKCSDRSVGNEIFRKWRQSDRPNGSTAS